jgi:hypothetical protein
MGGCWKKSDTPLPLKFNLKGKSQAVSPLPSIYLTVSLTGVATGTGARWERGGRTGQKLEGEREKERRKARGIKSKGKSIYCIALIDLASESETFS